MKVLNNIKIQEKCLTCHLHSDNFFCELSQKGLQEFESLKITNSYPKGTMLFLEGQPSHGIYMLCQGKVKLSTCSRDGKAVILHIAEAGEVLGLSATVSNTVYEVTAEVLELCQVNFVRKDEFIRFLQNNVEACMNAAQQLSRNYHTAYVQIRSLGLSNTAADKLAKLLLEWCKANGDSSNGCTHLKITFTHEEIAEMIGTSRETVSRLLKNFKSRKLITVNGSDLVIPDRDKLEASIGLQQNPR